MDAHRVIEWCKKVSPDKHDTLMEVMFRRYFQDAADLTQHEVLLGIVKEIQQLNVEDCAKMLTGSEMTTEVQSGAGRAKQMKVSGVPFFIIEPQPGAKQAKPVAFSGAQPANVITGILQEASGS